MIETKDQFGYSNAAFETLLGMRGSRKWGVCQIKNTAVRNCSFQELHMSS